MEHMPLREDGQQELRRREQQGTRNKDEQQWIAASTSNKNELAQNEGTRI
jgi:hypothetical protein